MKGIDDKTVIADLYLATYHVRVGLDQCSIASPVRSFRSVLAKNPHSAKPDWAMFEEEEATRFTLAYASSEAAPASVPGTLAIQTDPTKTSLLAE